MPIITQPEFLALLGPVGQAVSSDAAAWDMAREEAEHIISTRGALTIPADASQAPAWARLAAAWLIYHTLIIRTQPVQPELLEDARRRRQEALRLIEEEAARVPGDDQTLPPGFGEMEDVYSW